MNTQNKKIQFRKFGFLILVVLFFSSIVLPLEAQQKKQRNRKKEISVPDAILECPYTKEDILNNLKQFNIWVNAWANACEKQDFNQLLNSWEKKLIKQKSYRLHELEPFVFVPREQPEEKTKKIKKSKKNKKKQENSPEEPAVVAPQQDMGIFCYLTQRDLLNHYDAFALFLKFPRLTDDMQEATKLDKEAFLRYDKVIRNLEMVLKKMDNIRNRDASLTVFKQVFETEFKPALKAAVVAYEQLQKTKRMSSEKRVAIEERNRERRRKAYIARMEREQAIQLKNQSKQEKQ